VELQYDFEASSCYWVTISSIAFRRAFNEELAPLGITHRQSQVLACLVADGRLTQTELAIRMDIEPPTLAGIIDRMEFTGWVKRIACSEDKRRKWIVIEPAAAPIWDRIAACGRKVREAATSGMTEDEVNQLHALLKRVHSNLTEFSQSKQADEQQPGPSLNELHKTQSMAARH